MSHRSTSVEGRVESLLNRVGRAIGSLSEVFPGLAHRRRLASIDTKIVISGTRGKSSLARWLYEILHGRGRDTYAKVTGNRPVSLYDGERHPIERGNRVTLYENARELRKYAPDDEMILENQAITSYTTRAVNRFFARADVVVLSNVREDHLSTLGTDRYEIARSLVRAIPAGAHVVNGERDPHLRRYIDREVGRRGATVSHVTAPPEEAGIPGIESVYALNQALAAAGQPPLDEDVLASYREKMRVEWTRLPGGRVYNAAEVNDVQSTEMVRQSLVDSESDGESGAVEPFLYLRTDRRGRAVSFLHYLQELAERDEQVIGTVHVGGGMAELFERKAEFPVESHDVDREDAGSVLDALLAAGRPVVLMGNTVAEFMREMEAEIERRAERVDAPDGESDSPEAADADRQAGRDTDDRRRIVAGGAGERDRRGDDD